MEENPYQAPENQEPIASTKRPRKPVTLVEILVIVAILIVLIGLLMPAVGSHPRRRPNSLPPPTAAPSP